MSNYRNEIIVANNRRASVRPASISAQIIPQQGFIAVGAIQWKQKRLDMGEIKNAIKEIDVHCRTWISVFVQMKLRDKKDFYASLKIPEGFENYLFLENGEGKHVKAAQVNLPLFRELSIINPEISLQATFPARLAASDSALVTADTKKVILVISGLSEEKDVRLEWPVPLPVPEAPKTLQPILDLADFGVLYNQARGAEEDQ